MFFDILLLIASYTTTKAVRDAAFLSEFGLTELSYVMIGVAIGAGFLVSAFTRVTAGVARHRVIYLTNCGIAVTLVAVAAGFRAGWPWLSWALYFFCGVFGLLVVAEFWLLANDLFHAREAKRLFPIIGAGAILGGVVGGLQSTWLVRSLGTAGLLYIVAGQLLAAAVLSHLAWRLRPAEMHALRPSRAQPCLAAGLAIVRRNRYVRLLAVMMTCMTLCMTLVQWQYKGIAKLHFGSHRDDLTAFFGTLAALLSGASFLLQMFGTPRLLRRFGVKAGLRVLPFGFLVGAVALIASASRPHLGLYAAAVAMMLSDGFRFSVDRASVELLYLPIPRGVKDQAKPFIDTVVDRFAGALAACLWLFLNWAFQINEASHLPYASLVTVAVVLVWMTAIRRSRRGYVDAYRRMLAPASTLGEEAHPRTQECEALLRNLLPLDAPARTRALRSLGRLQRSEPTLRLHRDAIEPHLRTETRTVALLAQSLAAEGATTIADRRRPRPLLVRTLEEKLDEAVERITRLLALVYPQRDIVAARRALAHGSAGERAGALELLDNLLEGDAKTELLQVLDEVALGAAQLPREPREDTLAALLETDDRWLRACAAYTARSAALLSGRLDRMASIDAEATVQKAPFDELSLDEAGC